MAFDSKPRLAGSAGTSVLHNRFSAGLEYHVGLLKFLVIHTKSITGVISLKWLWYHRHVCRYQLWAKCITPHFLTSSEGHQGVIKCKKSKLDENAHWNRTVVRFVKSSIQRLGWISTRRGHHPLQKIFNGTWLALVFRLHIHRMYMRAFRKFFQFSMATVWNFQILTSQDCSLTPTDSPCPISLRYAEKWQRRWET